MNDWITLHLSDVADIRVSNVDKKIVDGEESVQLCNYMDVYTNDYIDSNIQFMQSTVNSVEREKFKISRGDVIITKDSETPYDIGIPAVVVEDIRNLVCGYHLSLIKPDKNIVDPVYLSKQLASDASARYFSRVAAGSTRYGLSNGAIAATAIKIAPIKQQVKISDILITLDQTIEKTEALIHKYQQIKAGLMHDLFTRGLTADGKLRPPRDQAPELYQETPIGWIPKEWVVIKASDICYPVTKGTTPSSFISFNSDAVPYIRVENLSFDGSLDFGKNSLFINTLTHNIDLCRSKVYAGDILMNIVGPPLGKVSLIPDNYKEWNVNQAIAIFRVLLKKHTHYLMYYLLSDIAQKWFLIRSKRTSGQINLTLEMCSNLEIPIPQNDIEMIKIAQAFDEIFNRIYIENNHLKKLKKLKSGLMDDLLTGKVQVNIDQTETGHV